VVLVNILSNPTASETVAEVIANYLLSQVGEMPILRGADREERSTDVTLHSHQGRSSSIGTLRQRSTTLMKLPQFVIRIVGGNLDSAKDCLAAIPIPVHWMDNLDEAVAQAISIAKSRVESSWSKTKEKK
jgi:succinyl-CoA synthetase beta subunit